MESYRTDNLPEELVHEILLRLPEELEHEILLRLPVKDLLVCTCVCKDWCALIKSPSFVNGHFNHESNRENLIFYGLFRFSNVVEEIYDPYVMYDDERHSLVEVPDHDLRQMPAHLITEGPEKGIFCLRMCFSLGVSLGLFNPATREFKKLPPIPQSHRQGIKYCPWIGCGLDPSSGDFKVVAFKQDKDCNYAFVYDLSSESWKTVETIDSYDNIGYSNCNSIPTLNGVKHWLIKSTVSNLYSILAFDMRSDKFQKIAIPDAIGKPEKTLQIITTYCDLVAVFSYKYCNEGINLWVMGGDGLWSKNFSIGPYSKIVMPLHVWKKNKLLFSTLSHLIICDVSTLKVTTLQLKDPSFCWWSSFSYKESLVSIKGKRDDCLEDFIRLYKS